jgi:hypothetical protein
MKNFKGAKKKKKKELCTHVHETRVLDPRPKLLRSLMPGPGPAPEPQIKRPGEGGRERRFMTQLRTCMGRGRRSTEPIFSHLRVTVMSYRFK